jgi:hypothetical protein
VKFDLFLRGGWKGVGFVFESSFGGAWFVLLALLACGIDDRDRKELGSPE